MVKNLLKNVTGVLKDGGIIRIAVPDLEVIVKEYLYNMQKAFLGDKVASFNYEWIMLELFDQMVRNYSGGQMAEYLFYQKEIPNIEFVYKRIGVEGRKLREKFLNTKQTFLVEDKTENKINLKKLIYIFKQVIKRRLLKMNMNHYLSKKK